MMSYTAILITVLVVYLIFNLVAGLWVSNRQAKADTGKGFINNYFIGGRSMGGLVLAMTLVATFTSASSFIGGPGVREGTCMGLSLHDPGADSIHHSGHPGQEVRFDLSKDRSRHGD